MDNNKLTPAQAHAAAEALLAPGVATQQASAQARQQRVLAEQTRKARHRVIGGCALAGMAIGLLVAAGLEHALLAGMYSGALAGGVLGWVYSRRLPR